MSAVHGPIPLIATSMRWAASAGSSAKLIEAAAARDHGVRGGAQRHHLGPGEAAGAQRLIICRGDVRRAHRAEALLHAAHHRGRTRRGHLLADDGGDQAGKSGRPLAQARPAHRRRHLGCDRPELWVEPNQFGQRIVERGLES